MPTTFPTSQPDSVWLPTTSTTRHRRIPRSTRSRRSAWIPFLVSSLLFPGLADAIINLSYCSPENTGSDYKVFFDIYQSDGKCHDHCIDKYAFGIVLGQNCWCSNYPPLDQKSLDDCSDGCPGFPDDRCGNAKKKYFNYIELGLIQPSPRTDIPPSSTTSSSEPSKIEEESTTTTDPPPTTDDPSPTPFISVVTIQGSQRTVTVTPAPTQSSKNSMTVNAQESNDFFSDTGRVAGVFVGVGLAILLLIALIFFLRKRKNDRRKSMDSSDHPEMGMSGPGSPNLGSGSSSPNGRPRSTSTLGLVGGYQAKAPVITTTGFAETDRVTDQRLDPNQIWMRFDNDNGSRVSLRSLQDNQDYTRRVLKLTNPDG